MEKKEVTRISQEEIAKFMEGTDPQERIVNLAYSYQDDFIRVFYRNKQDEKIVQKQDFYPFLWATYTACDSLCGGNRQQVQQLLNKYQIGVKRLSNKSIDGEIRHEFDDGYLFMFYAKKAMSYSRFLHFFKDAGNPVYADKKDKKNNSPIGRSDDNKQYLTVTPQEQFLISTGKRFFKGYNDYDELLRMIFDLETEGLNPEKDRIKLNGIRLNRPVTIKGHEYKDFGRIFQIKGETEEEKNKSELEVIEIMLKIIYTFKPDIITAHNGENFDWNFIIKRCEVLGTSMEELSKKYFDGEFIKKENRESVLKLGGEVETFYKTIVPNTIVTDSLHAARRAQATNSNIKKADLKYMTAFLGLKKDNRVYTPGAEIDNILEDKVNKYAFNDENGDWYIYDETSSHGKDEEFKLGKEGDKRFIIHKRNYLADGYEIVTGEYIIHRYLLDDLWECDKVEYTLNGSDFMLAKFIPVPFSKCTTMGTAGQWKALMLAWSYEHNLAIPNLSNSVLPIGGLSRLLRTGHVKNIAKLDYNSLYPSIILTWGLKTTKDLDNVMLAMLEYVLTNREYYKGIKKKADKEIQRLNKVMLKRELTETEEEQYKASVASFKSADNMQAVVKKLGNSNFGAVSASNVSVFPWADVEMGGQITCTGRQSLRLMISHFHNLGYEPIVGDTDGFNFKLPDNQQFRYTEEHPYIGLGLNREVKKGEKYTGFEADVAEFNDLYMKDFHYNPLSINKMGLGIDEVVNSTINFSRKNYCDFFPENPYPEDVKLVGNTIKSKKMPTYIEKFLDKSIRQLLRGEGKDFIEYYYEYLTKIYNYQIPLRDIAAKGKIKKSIKEYKQDIKEITKAGRPKSRQAWYELAIKENLHVDNGDTIYYVNTGTSKSHSDVKKITHYYYINADKERIEFTTKIDSGYKKYKKECIDTKPLEKQEWIAKEYPGYFTEEEIVLNCALITRDIVDNEEDIYCNEENGIEYNVPKYIEVFNKRIKPLLVCFNKDVRDRILVSNPEDRNYFTEDECVLTSGEPNKPSDQDTYEQLMTMEDKEIRFWMKYGLTPPFLQECGMGTWEEIQKDYLERQQREKELGIDKTRESYEKVLNGLYSDEISSYMEDGTIPASILKVVDLNEETGSFVSKEYPDIVIGNPSDIFDVWERKRNERELSDTEETSAIAE